MEVMNPRHTRGLLRWGKQNVTQRFGIKFFLAFCAGRPVCWFAGGGGLGPSFPAEAKGEEGEWELGALQPSSFPLCALDMS